MNRRQRTKRRGQRWAHKRWAEAQPYYWITMKRFKRLNWKSPPQFYFEDSSPLPAHSTSQPPTIPPER